MLRFVREDVVWQEVPHEVSLAYTIAGCPLRCPGCHSADTWNARQGRALSPAYLQRRLGDYAGLLSCVLFFGGEWQTAALLECLRTARAAFGASARSRPENLPLHRIGGSACRVVAGADVCEDRRLASRARRTGLP